MAGPQSSLLSCPACAESSSYWWVGPSHQVADYRAPGGPRASAGPMVGGSHGWVVVRLGGSRSSVSLLVGRASS